MVDKDINLWVEGDIATNRIIFRLLNELDVGIRAEVRLIEKLDWEALVGKINIFSRVCTPRYSWLPGYLSRHHVRYIYYLDDNFWQLFGDSDLAKYYQSPAVIRALDEFVQYASLVLLNSKYLFDFIRDRFPAVRCCLVRPPFDLESTRALCQLRGSGRVRSYPVVGYAGGYKQEEFDFLSDVILLLQKKRPDIRFEFIGSVPSRLKSNPSVQWFPGYAEYAEFLAFKSSRQWTVGLAPLFSNSFNSSKTDNKFREYGGCCIPGIYSDVAPYNLSVRSGVTGILVENDVEQWVQAIITVVDRIDLQQSISKEAFDYVETHYSHPAVGAEWIHALNEVNIYDDYSSIEKFRFDQVKTLSLNNEYSAAKKVENEKTLTLIKVEVCSYLRAFFSRRKALIFLYLLVIITLFNINFYLFGCFSR